MKKLLAGIVTIILVFCVGIMSVFAAGTGRGRNSAKQTNPGICTNSQPSCSFTDTDNDGICDNYNSSVRARSTAEDNQDVSGNGSGGSGYRHNGNGNGAGAGRGCQRRCSR